jgi:hypothetical protein
MRPAEHYRRAEELLEQARTPILVTAPDSTSQQEADEIQEALAARGIRDALVHPESVRIDASGLLAAAQVHATLALAGSQLRSLTAEGSGDLEDSP